MHGSNTDEGTIRELRYDHRDINISAIVRWTSIFFAFVIGCIFAALAAYKFFTPDWAKEERALPAFVTARRVPPFPQVQADPKLDMELYKAAEEPGHEAVRKAKEEAAAKGISGVGNGPEVHETASFPGSGDYKGLKTEEKEH